MVTEPEGLRQILDEVRSIAVIGYKGPGKGPAHSVPGYMQEQGYTILPVNPKLSDKLSNVVATVNELTEAVDMVNIFRRSDAIAAHADEILKMVSPPRVVWLQLGIRNDEAATRLARAGILVVQDRCLLVEHRRFFIASK
ncbi:MAG: CoA-binding protein [Bradymonadaceae bacterium]|nr:CoA-binding protein [Lujinxingiaceae bacterium]